MSLCTRKLIEGYLDQYGWAYRCLESGQISSGWQGEEHLFPLRIDFYENWVALQVRPFEKLKIEWESWPEISRYLLEWGDACHMVKLTIGPEGDINIGLDLLLEGLSSAVFTNNLNILGYYVEKLYDDLLNYLDGIGFSYCKSLGILA